MSNEFEKTIQNDGEKRIRQRFGRTENNGTT